LIKINENQDNANGHVRVSEIKYGPIDRFGHAYSDKINDSLRRMDDSVKKVTEGAGENKHESVAHERIRSAKLAEINHNDDNGENRKNEKKGIEGKPRQIMSRIETEQGAFIVNEHELHILPDNAYRRPIVEKIHGPQLGKQIEEKTYDGYRNKKQPLRFCRFVVHYRLHYYPYCVHTLV
jgi:hypothetical protein